MNIIKKDKKTIRLLVEFFVTTLNNEDLYLEFKAVIY